MFFVLISLLLGATSPQESRVHWCHMMPSEAKEIHLPKNEVPMKYYYWCGQENEKDRTTCKRCGRPV